MSKWVVSGLLISVLLLAACGPGVTPTVVPSPVAPSQSPSPSFTPQPPPTTTPAVAQEGILISEVLPGVYGVNNTLEFIELYNAGTAPVDLDGWSLWYCLADGKEEELVYAWDRRTDVPGHGHYLLVKSGQDVGNRADAEYSLALFEKKGGLALRDLDDQIVDTLAWGEGPSDYLANSAAAVPEGGASLERLPGGEAGNGQITGDHSADFAPNPEPNPQNTGDPVTPRPQQRLDLRLDLPQTVDHILVTPSLYEHLLWVEAVHICADYPPPIPGDLSARRTSDHDPVVVVFSFE